jgi:hypothetical protein
MLGSRLPRLLALLVAVLASVSFASPLAAHATAPVAQLDIVGTGTISPGLPCTGCSVNFVFSGVFVDDAPVVLSGCTLSGTATGTLTSESGSGVIGGCAMTGSVVWARVGAVLTISGRVCVNGRCYCLNASAFAWVFLSAPPPVFGYGAGGAAALAPC